MVIMDLKTEGEESEHDLSEFIARWRLDSEAQDVLYNLPPDALAKVIVEFAPRDTTKDCNNIFMKFARGITLGVPQKTSIQAHHDPTDDSTTIEKFMENWGLGSEAKAVFMTLDAEQRQRVMADFAPRDISRDCNVMFIKFAQGIANNVPRMVGNSGMAASGKGGSSAPRSAVAPQYASSPIASPGQQKPPTASAIPAWQGQAAAADVDHLIERVSEAMLDRFIATWSLDEESQKLLYGLSPAVFVKVVSDFSPRDTSRDANNIFRSFVHSLSTRMGMPPAVRSQQPVAVGATPVVVPARQVVATPAATSDTAPSPLDMMAFVQTWSLHEEAQAVLFSLRPDAAARVMRDFQPRDASFDANNIFMKFAQGVSRNMAAAEATQAARLVGMSNSPPAAKRFAPY